MTLNSLNSLGETWPTIVRYTNDPLRTLWRELNRFSGDAAANTAFKIRGTDHKNVTTFVALNKLGDSYFLGYEDVTDIIDPLLLYYGGMTLGLAAAYLTLPSAELDTRSPVHGIKPHVDNQLGRPFFDCKLQIGESSGTFNLVNRAFGGEDVSSQTFNLLDFLRTIPELDASLRTVVGVSSATNCVRVARNQQLTTGAALDRGRISVEMDRDFENLDHALSKIAVADYLRTCNVALTDKHVLSWDRERSLANEEVALFLDPGEHFLLPKINGRVISQYAILLGVLYALSELCRYYPMQWISLYESNSAEHYIIREFVQVASETLPKLALDHFAKSTYTFHTK